MKKKACIILFLAFYLLGGLMAHAQTNAGFVQENIWYSKDPLEEGDKVKIYTVIFNPDPRELSGTVSFYDKTVVLGKKNFSVAARDVSDISIDWNVTAGSHTIFARIETAKFLIAPNRYEDAALEENKTSESSVTVRKKAGKEDVIKAGSESIEKLGNLIEERTPKFISNTIVGTIETVEGFRESLGNKSESYKESARQGLKADKDPENKESEGTASKIPSKILRPFNYIKLFFLSLVSFLFNNRIVFYSLFFFLLFFIFRFAWRRIFR